MTFIWDIIVLAVIIFFVSISAKRGLIRSSHTILSIIVTAILLTTMQPVIMEYIQGSQLGDNIKQSISENVTKTYERESLPEDTDTTDTDTSLMICQTIGLPNFLSKSLEGTIKQMSEVKNNVLELITDTISLTILRLIAAVLLFVLVRLFVFLILKILESLFSLPGLKTINHSLGALLGIFNALLAIYLICGAVSLFTPVEHLQAIKQTVDSTYILKYFYENNLLLSMFV